MPHAIRSMYAISLCLYTILLCPPPKCVNLRTAHEKDVDRSIFPFFLLTFPRFHLLCCSLPHHCRRPLWVVLYSFLLQHGCGTITRTSNAVGGLAATVGRALTNYYCETWVSWQKRRKNKKNRPQRSRYIDVIPIFFAEGLKKRRESKKKKPQRSR